MSDLLKKSASGACLVASAVSTAKAASSAAASSAATASKAVASQAQALVTSAASSAAASQASDLVTAAASSEAASHAKDLLGAAGSGVIAARRLLTDQAKAAALASMNGVFGEDSVKAMEAVMGITKNVFASLFPDSKPEHPLVVNLAMLLRQVKQDGRYFGPLLSAVSYSDQEVLQKAARYGTFANAAYLKTKEEVVQKIPDLTPELIHHMEKSCQVACPNFFIAEDPMNDTIVLAIRGTHSIVDALTDASCTEVAFLGGQAHEAISKSARKVVEIAKPILEDLLKKAPARKVVVTGHSLGAGVSVLTTLLLFSELSDERIHVPSLAECFAFAPPPVFYSSAALPSLPSIYSFVHSMDCIPRCCLGTCVKLALAIREIDAMSIGLTERVKFISGQALSCPTLPDYMEIPGELRSKFTEHKPVGILILLYTEESGNTRCEVIAPDMTDRMLLHPSMMSDHSMKGYLKRLDAVCDDLLAEAKDVATDTK